MILFAKANFDKTENMMNSNQTQPNSTGASDIGTVTIVQVTSYALITILGTVANLLLYGALLGKKQRSPSEYFVLNLAFTDLVTCAVGIPLDMAEILIQRWPFGALLCKVVYPFQTALIGVSVATLTCMAIERYRAIVTPFKPMITKRMVKVVISAVWCISGALVSPYIVVLEHKREQLQCTEAWPSENYPKMFTMCVFLLFYSLPLCIIAPAYICIGFRLYSDGKKMKRFSIKQGAGNQSFRKLVRQRTRTNVIIVKTFLFGAVAFSLCLLPYHIMWLWADFGNGAHWSYFGDVLVFANALVYFNSLVDPFIFGGTVIRHNWSKTCAAMLQRCLNIQMVNERRKTNNNVSLKQQNCDNSTKKPYFKLPNAPIIYTSSV